MKMTLAIHTYTDRSSAGGTTRVSHTLAPERAITLWCSAKIVNRSALTASAAAVIARPVRRRARDRTGRRSSIRRTRATGRTPRRPAMLLPVRRDQGRPGGCACDRYYRDMPPAAPRIVISGIGVTSCFGVGRECFWDHVSRGVSGTRTITEFDVSDVPCRVAAPVPPVTITDAQPLAEKGPARGNPGPIPGGIRARPCLA